MRLKKKKKKVNTTSTAADVLLRDFPVWACPCCVKANPCVQHRRLNSCNEEEGLVVIGCDLKQLSSVKWLFWWRMTSYGGARTHTITAVSINISLGLNHRLALNYSPSQGLSQEPPASVLCASRHCLTAALMIMCVNTPVGRSWSKIWSLISVVFKTRPF